MKKIGIIFGGKSGEHEVSRLSAFSVINSIDTTKYTIVTIGITKEGQWKLFTGDMAEIPDGSWEHQSVNISIGQLPELIDFALPILHGPYGEDGTIQGLFEMMNIPYAGCGVLASALCMDKITAKEIFVRNNIPTCPFTFTTAEDVLEDIDRVVSEIENKLPYNLFVKPSNMGSSVGISKVKNRNELLDALILAAKYDRRIIIEQEVDGREIETGVVGNRHPEVAAVGEITSSMDFYDYQAKYSDDAGTQLYIPANIPDSAYEKVRQLAKQAYIATDCAGFARIDFFMDRDSGEIFINEINTIPGFTKYSMFPMLWENTGVSMEKLVERIVILGYERYNAKNSR